MIADPLVGRSETETGYKSEGYFPLNLESLGAEYPVAIGSEGKVANTEDYLDEHNGTEQADANAFARSEEALAYGHAVPTATGMWWQYRYYYYYNIGTAGIDNHEGDWEMVQVYVTKNSGYLRDKTVFSQHAHSVVCQRGEYQTEGSGPGFGGHVVVHIADGTHASYPFSGTYETESEFAADVAKFSKYQEAPAATKVYYGEPLERPHTPKGLSWPGKWGASTGELGTGDSPHGPAFHGIQWSNPEAWAAESKPCLFNILSREPKEEPGQQQQGVSRQSTAAGQAEQNGFAPVAPSATQTGATIVLSNAQLSNGKLSVEVDTSQLKEAGVQPIIVDARPVKYEHPPQTVNLGSFIGKKQVTFPVPVATANGQEITASAILGKEPVVAEALTK